MDAIVRSTTVPKSCQFKELDFVSEGKSITVKGKETIQTKVGACITLSIYCLLMWALYYFVSRFLDTTNPTIQFNQIKESGGLTLRYNEIENHFFLLIANPLRNTVKKNSTISDESANQTSRPSPDDNTAFQQIGTITKNIRHIASNEDDPIDAPYLSFKALSRYFDYSLGYIVREVKVNESNSSQIYEEERKVNLSMIRCSETDWFSNQKYRSALEGNRNALAQITKYGICFNLSNTDLYVYGDALSSKQGYFQMNISICEYTGNTTCQENAERHVKAASYLKLILGNLEPGINNTNKYDPIEWDINIDNIFTISSQLEVFASVYLKQITAITDVGVLVESLVEESKAAIGAVTRSINSKIGIGSPKSGGTGDFYVTKEQSKLVFSLTIEASRTTEQFIRSYDRILDLFGNIGGTIEFILVVFLIFFHWYENYIGMLRMRRAVGNHLGLPEKMRMHGFSVFNMCSKKNSEEKIHALDEIVEESVAMERMAENNIYSRLVQKYMLSKEVVEAAPAIHMMEKMIEKKTGRQEEIKDRQMGSSSIVDTERLDGDDEEDEGARRPMKTMLDLQQKIESISVTDSQVSWAIKTSFMNTFMRFKEEFGDSPPENFFGGSSNSFFNPWEGEMEEKGQRDNEE